MKIVNRPEQIVLPCAGAFWPLMVAAILFVPPTCVFSDTGTFIDRHLATDLRVVSYNILNQSIFPDVDAVQAEKFERVLAALDPDILNFQEIICHGDCTRKTAEDVRSLLNTLAPLPGGESWVTHKGTDNVIASKYPLSMQRTETEPSSERGLAIALVDLPDDRYGADLYVMNNHFKCCNTMEPPEPLDPYQQQRQRHADALVNWMRDARTMGESIDLPNKTPMLVVGDLNIYNDLGLTLDPLGTVLSGDIYDEETFGADSPPDWDGTSLSDAHPLHNGSGPDDYTWRNDNSQLFEPGRLDYILYTDSVIQEANKFVLNTVDMTTAELMATNLQTYDITIDELRYDHLPVVTDFRIPSIDVSADFDFDGDVDGADFLKWQRGESPDPLSAEDLAVWEASHGTITPLSAASAAVPEPSSAVLLIAMVTVRILLRRRGCDK